MKYRLLATITPLADKTASYPEGMPIIENESKWISKRGFRTIDDAEDYLAAKGYSKGTGFWVKNTKTQFETIEILPLI